MMQNTTKELCGKSENKQRKSSGISSSFIIKIVFFCILTSFLIVMLLSVVLSVYMGSIMQNEAMENSRQTIETMNEFFDKKVNAVKRLLYGMYQDRYIRGGIQNFFSDSNTPGEDVHLIQQCSEMLNSRYGYADNALTGVSLYGLERGKQAELLQTYCFKNREETINQLLQDAKIQLREDVAKSRAFYSVYIQFDSDHTFLNGTFTVYDFIRDPHDLTSITGILAFHYDMDRISKQLSRYIDGDSKKVFLLSDRYGLLYSSDKDYESLLLQDFSDFRQRKPHAGFAGTMYESSGYLLSVAENDRFDLKVVNLVNKWRLYEDIWRLDFFVFSMMCVALVIISVLVWLFSKRISRRIASITEGIHKIEQGDLHTVIPTTKNADELDLIAGSLTNMCNSLRENAQLQQQAQQQRNEAVLCQKDAEIYALQAQINPHFLYNMLEVARMKAAVDGCEDTAMMIKLLASIFRGSVGRGALATIGEELECCMHYVRLFEIRRESSIKVQMNVSPEIRKCMICTHILLPIVENALVHGVPDEHAQITISAQRVDNDISFTIEDNGPGVDAEQLEKLQVQIQNYGSDNGHIGLANVNKRLHLIYGEQYGICIESGEGKGFTVRLSIRVGEKEGGHDDVQCTVGR